MELNVVRVVRTPSSERFLLRAKGADFAALDIHYLPEGRADATLILFEGGPVPESQVPELLSTIDEMLLPGVSLQEKNLVFTVVTGRVMGAYSADKSEGAAAKS